ncbi:ankyrin homolog [Ptychodera flava]|uniref:ankyrin homolog n=1 Tax=Ptychodera flava TaxID=63121 RepID=UPI00396A33C7
MVELLLEKGAEIDARAGENGYTPLAFAASNDACDVLSLLYQRGADIHLRGRKGRTALMAAAIADRSEASKLLLNLGARAEVVDDNGEPCIVTMLAKMPTVAPGGLNQLHEIDSANRQQMFHLQHLEPWKASKSHM